MLADSDVKDLGMHTEFRDEPMTLTWLGRIAFPLYVFLLAEGFLIVCHDKERLNKHLAIMLILTVVSFPGFALIEERLNFANYLDSQSNMVTLLIGYAGMLVTEALLPSTKELKESCSKLKVFAIACAYCLMGLDNYMMKGNFNIVGPLLVIAFYWFIRVSKALSFVLFGSYFCDWIDLRVDRAINAAEFFIGKSIDQDVLLLNK